MFMTQNSVNFWKYVKIYQSILAHSQSSLRRNAVPWKNYKHFLPSYFIQQTPIKWITYTLAGRNRPILRVLLVKHLKLAVQMLIQLQNRRQIPWPIAVIRRRPHLQSHASFRSVQCTQLAGRSTDTLPSRFDARDTPDPTRLPCWTRAPRPLRTPSRLLGSFCGN